MLTMTPEEMDVMLDEILEDRRLSRSEKRVLDSVVQSIANNPHQRALLQHRAFAVARAAITWYADRQVLDWVEDVVKVLHPVKPNNHQAPKQSFADVYFSGSHDCSHKIVELIDNAKSTVDICVFTITDNHVSKAVIRAFERDVGVRIVTDDDKSNDRGSDIDRFKRAGLDVRIDRSPSHMHHKFAIFDRRLLLTGSYNWTRGAAQSNEENFLVTDNAQLLQPYADEFEKLWVRFSDDRV